MTIFTLPNFLSFLRIPLALLFLQENVALRVGAIITAMISDGLDGYLARKNKIKSRFGAFLDPAADKIFVLTVVLAFVHEGKLDLWQVIALGCRDLSVLIFGFYLFFNEKLSNYQFRAIRCGKITTFLQFIVLFCLTINVIVPPPVYITFILLGLLSLVELLIPRKTTV